MLEVKGNEEEIQVFKRTIINMDDCIFGYEYCGECVLFCGDIDCEECVERNINFIVEEEN